jgi:NHL repeat
MSLRRRPRTSADLPGLVGSRKRAVLALATAICALAFLFFTAPALAAEQPWIRVGAASSVTASCATLHAEVDPFGAETTYQFEYISEKQFKEDGNTFGTGTAKAPEPAESVGSDEEFHRLSTEICGLSHLTTYRFRPVATNSQSPPGGTLGEPLTFITLAYGPSHALITTIAGSGTNSLSGPTDVAVDQSNGDIYVADTGNHRVEKFTASGTFIFMFGAGVDKSKVEKREEEQANHEPITITPAEEDLCTAASGETCQAGASTSAPGGFEAPTYLAVDNSGGPSTGDIYVADNGQSIVSKFDASGHIVSTWGREGQQDGSGLKGAFLPDNYTFHSGFFGTPGRINGLTIGPKNGDLYVHVDTIVWTFTQVGVFVPMNLLYKYSPINSEAPGLQVDPAGTHFYYFWEGLVARIPIGSESPNQDIEHVTVAGPPGTGLALDPTSAEIYLDAGSRIYHYSPACEPLETFCSPIDSFGAGQLSAAAGLALYGPSSDARIVYVADPGANHVAVFGDIRPLVSTEAATEISETGLTLSGHITPAANHPGGHPEIVECRFEYGLTSTYGHSAPCEPDPEVTPFTGSTEVQAKLSGLTPTANLPPGTEYHYRLLATNAEGATGFSSDRASGTAARPQIEAVSSAHVTATSAELRATVKPNALPTTYRFQFGPTTAYGESTPAEEITTQLSAVHTVKAEITGLQPGVTYHFRFLAENQLDQGNPATSEDQTFEFFPPACPNAAIRQQTSSNYLPDCRAYELVSPENASGTLFFPGGPNTGRATSPSRLAFTGAYSAPPGAEPINTMGDLYVASRSDTGWSTHYVGLPGDQGACMGGPPTGTSAHAVFGAPTQVQNQVLTDPSMSRFLDFLDGAPTYCVLGSNGVGDVTGEVALASNAPYLWNAEGGLLGHLPSNLESLPGALEALACPGSFPNCSGETTASGDLTHIVFSSNNFSFAEKGLTQAPGSAYDDDLATGKVTLISRLPGGQPISQDPGYATKEGANSEFLRFPFVSRDGSRILISTATVRTSPCQNAPSEEPCRRFTDTPVHLYLRVGDLLTKEISVDQITGNNVAVHYVGSAEDGSKVFFTSEEQLIPGEETSTNSELYMWSEKGEEKGHPLTLISKPASGADTTEECQVAITKTNPPWVPAGTNAPWTAKCDAVPYSGYSYSLAPGGLGGNGNSDTAIASTNGDIYFYSPQLLDGNRGVEGDPNLYDYREGSAHFIATFKPDVYCAQTGKFSGINCSEGPIVRLEVTPDDSRMALVTSSRLTSYNNAGHLEMYSYTPNTGALICDSCNPDGSRPTADVHASQDGLFLTDDGRTFFSTSEALVPQDTNEGMDVYEFANGRPQLITPGTGTTAASTLFNRLAEFAPPGLVGVSSNGTDVYFSTYDTLTAEDHNGAFLKFYDARTNGGFPQPPPAQPCAAAEECHGPAAEAPTLPAQGTAATLTGGNVHHHSHHHKRRHRRAHGKRHGHRTKRSGRNPR